MATMVKEKRREKKKSKEKSNSSDTVCDLISTNLPDSIAIDDTSAIMSVDRDINREDETEYIGVTHPPLLDITIEEISPIPYSTECQAASVLTGEKTILHDTSNISQSIEIKYNPLEGLPTTSHLQVKNVQTDIKTPINITDNYEFLNKTLERIAIPELTESVTEARELELSNPDAYLKPSEATEYEPYELNTESTIPSAPVFEVETQLMVQHEEQIPEIKPKLQCIPIEEALKIFVGKEMSVVKMISEKEEAMVEAGPASGPEHPLVDLLSTFKSSLRALENERSRLTCAVADEDKSRSTLWKVEKRHLHMKKQCKCGSTVEMRASYEHAQLLKERMPAARLKLDSLLRDIQDSYCHHQHAVLLAHCQIDEVISETVQSNPRAIRDALSLIMRALRLSEDAPATLPAALQRWAAALVAALPLSDVSHLLFVLHHLARQSRSVVWAARVLSPRVPDAVGAARALAVIDTVAASPRVDGALECTEEDEGWEEVSARGAGAGAGGVREGAWREMDLLALLRAFPLRDLLARILLFTHSDIRGARPSEWGDARGGHDVLAACCGVRALLHTMQRVTDAHRQYARLRATLRRIAAAALEGLSCLYRSPRAPYGAWSAARLEAELEACFVAAFTLFDTEQLHTLDTSLLARDSAARYCLAFISSLHDSTPREIESMSIYAPVLPCAERVRIVACAAQRRRADHELARTVLDYLLQRGGEVSAPSARCGGACGGAARAHLAPLLSAHPHLRTAALLAVSHLAQVSTLEPLLVSSLEVDKWRPEREEMEAVLQAWAQRCPQLLHLLLLQLDCTPFTGLSLEVQLAVGGWLCERQRRHPADGELCWRVLVRLRTHRAYWRLPSDAPDPLTRPLDLFSTAYALLSTSWGDSIPLICSHGVDALCALSVRPDIQVHCLGPMMLRMAHSPDSVSLTPRFSVVLTSILRSGPGLVQRALGRGGVSGADLLLSLLLTQIQHEREESAPSGGSVLAAWLHALWRLPPGAGAHAADTAVVAARGWRAAHQHAANLLQEEDADEIVCNAVRHAATAPLLCECLLRAAHRREQSTQMFGALANLLWEQRVSGQKVHVDNALQKIKGAPSSGELVIYRCASAALAAAPRHPAHLALWTLFFHLYLQRPPAHMRETARPVGPLFFSGLIKSRTLTQLIKRLQETAAYHKHEAETYKTTQTNQPPNNRDTKCASITSEEELLPGLSIEDMTGEASGSDCESELSEDSEEDSNGREKETVGGEGADTEGAFNMACYHTAAERMVREMCGWLEEGEEVRAEPHHAHMDRFIPQQALEAAWRHTVSRARPAPDPAPAPAPDPAPAPAPVPALHTTPLDEAVAAIMTIKERSGPRSVRVIKSPLEDVDVNNSKRVLDAVDRYVRSVEELATEWCEEVGRVSSLDRALWEAVCSLRAPRPLPPAPAPCPAAAHHKCSPTLFYIQEREWCVSPAAERALQQNRRTWSRAVRVLCRARPAAARTVAALHSVARRVRDKSSAVSAVDRIWRAAGAQATHCGAARDALYAALQILAEAWLCEEAQAVARLVGRCSSPLHEAMCGALVAPRRLPTHAWPALYTSLLRAPLPAHARFSYLSKFEMSEWRARVESEARREVLGALLAAQADLRARDQEQEHAVLLELLGVHTGALLTAHEMAAVVMQWASLSAEGALPARQWPYLLAAVDATVRAVPVDRLSQVCSELGALWWRARSAPGRARSLAPHAEHVAALHARLLRALVAAAQALTYSAERVGRVAWSAFSECWGAWIVPHPSAPALLPAPAEYSLMLSRALSLLKDTIASSPGCEIVMLESVFEWACACHAACEGSEGRAHASELLAALEDLPWSQHQWFTPRCLSVATQVCASKDVELRRWWCARWQNTTSESMLRDVRPETVAARLQALLYLLTAVPLPHGRHICEAGAALPWHALPPDAHADALDRYFAAHHHPHTPYHETMQFQVILHASMLRGPAPEGGRSRAAHEARARAVSAWCRAAAAPALIAHCAAAARAQLDTLAALAPHVAEASGELEELLGRASPALCLEPAAALVLPVWQEWVEGAAPAAQRACVSAASALTAAAGAPLADTAVRAALRDRACGWEEVVSRWHAASPWREPDHLISRTCLYAAYACARAFQLLQHCGPTLHALRDSSPLINFTSNEAIIAVWICYACRAALTSVCDLTSGSANEGAALTSVNDRTGGSANEGAALTSVSDRTGGSANEGAALTSGSDRTGGSANEGAALTSGSDRTGGSANEAALSLLHAWAQPARRSLLKVVTLQADEHQPTARHRVLCRMALCVVAPSEEARRAYEAACAAAGDVPRWARGVAAPRAALVPRLAAALLPSALTDTLLACEATDCAD